jgi:hypothetical protein
MRKILVAILLTALCFTACSKNEYKEPDDPNTAGFFMANLNADLKYDDIVNLFGAPDGDIGSGIHIYVYDLTDGSKIYIGYTDKILYARHMNSSGQVLHNII